MTVMDNRPWPKSPAEATDLGYTDGRALHDKGAKPEDLKTNIEIFQGSYSQNDFYGDWLKGFEAGYLGNPKPIP
jgi:hypothetical protein